MRAGKQSRFLQTFAILAVLLRAPFASAEVSCHQGQVLAAPGQFAQPGSGAMVSVCPDGTQPCNAAGASILIYSDILKAHALSNPFPADPSGNYAFCADANFYAVGYQLGDALGGQGTTLQHVELAALEGTGSTDLSSPPPIGNTVPNTVAATVLNAASVNGEVSANAYYTGDMFAAINAAEASSNCPSTGCVITIAPAASCYPAATGLVYTKPIVWKGAAGGATCIQYTGSPGSATRANFTGAGPYAWGPRDIRIVDATNGGASFSGTCNSPGTTTFGANLGGSTGAAGYLEENVVWLDFGINTYVNPGGGVFYFRQNGGKSGTAGLNYCHPDSTPNSGESMSFYAHTFFGYGPVGPGDGRLRLSSIYLGAGNSANYFFDPAVEFDDAQLLALGGYVKEWSHHEVYPNVTNQDQPMVVCGGPCLIGGDYWFDDSNAGHPVPPAFVDVANAVTTVAGAQFETANSALNLAVETTTTVTNTFNLTSVAASDPTTGYTVYTGTITGGDSSHWAYYPFVISGFTSGVNNISGVSVASTATTLTLFNPNANSVAETHAATAAITYGGCVNEMGTNWLSNGGVTLQGTIFRPASGFSSLLVTPGSGTSYCQTGSLNNISHKNLFNGPLMGQGSPSTIDLMPSTDDNFNVNVYAGLTSPHAANFVFNTNPAPPLTLHPHIGKFFFSLSAGNDFDFCDFGDATNGYISRCRDRYFGGSTLDRYIIAPALHGVVHLQSGATPVDVFTIKDTTATFPQLASSGTQCAQLNAAGDLSGTGSACGSGAGGATIAHVTNVIKGDGSGNGVDAGFASSTVVLNNQANTYGAGLKQTVASNSTAAGWHDANSGVCPSGMLVGDFCFDKTYELENFVPGWVDNASSPNVLHAAFATNQDSDSQNNWGFQYAPLQLAKIENGVSGTSMVELDHGDSDTSGFGATQKSWVYPYAAAMQSTTTGWGSAGCGWVTPQAVSSSKNKLPDCASSGVNNGSWTLCSFTDGSVTNGHSGACWGLDNTDETASTDGAYQGYTAVMTGCRMYFAKQTGGGSAHLFVDGSDTANGSTNASSGILSLSCGSLTEGPHAIKAQVVGGGSNVTYLGGYSYDATTGGVLILKAAAAANSVVDFAANTRYAALLTQVQADLVSDLGVGISLIRHKWGANEYNQNIDPRTGMLAALDTLVQAEKTAVPLADISISSDNDYGAASIGGANTRTMWQYDKALNNYANANRLPFISILRHTYPESANSTGNRGCYASDNLHMGPNCQTLESAIVMQRTFGKNTNPAKHTGGYTWTKADINGNHTVLASEFSSSSNFGTQSKASSFSSFTITLPASGLMPPANSYYRFFNVGSGVVTLAAGTGCTLVGGGTAFAQNEGAEIWYDGVNCYFTHVTSAAPGSGGGGDAITSPGGTLTAGGTSTNTTLDTTDGIIPRQVFKTAQSVTMNTSANSNLSTTTMITPGADGNYLAWATISTTTPGTGCSAGSLAVRIGYTDRDTGTAVGSSAGTSNFQILNVSNNTSTATASITNSAAAFRANPVPIAAKSGVDIIFYVDEAGAQSGCSVFPVVEVRPHLEYVGN
jgi:hypothetical protein